MPYKIKTNKRTGRAYILFQRHLTKDRYRFLHGEPWIQNGECVFKATYYKGRVVVWVLMGKRIDDIAYLNVKTVEGLKDGDFDALYKIAKGMV
uniref:Uncharacterized protein n=1 Tax=Podoviridae sp. ctUS21 TaxID=2826557 RepID=A0A8S5MQX3_9CAUD|nr:MAG TPA: hypothetical protein [Podoviridae sp. ctUS21]